jgi:uncharacterized membrane protein YecN with MAPEG domain
MHTPVVSTAAAGLLGIIFIVLSARVVMGRTASKTLFGSGNSETDPLFVSIRSHANFAEFVPICLLILAGLEIRSGATILVKVLAAILVLARIAHPIGMAMKTANPFRAAGFVGTILVLAVGSLAAIYSLFG